MSKGWIFLKWTVFGLLIISLIGWITMSMWNWLVPELFNGPVISFWQALGLLILSKLLFWGFGGKHHCQQCHHAEGSWKHKVYNHFSSMTPEEREAFKQKMKDKWCRYDTTGTDDKSGGSNG